MPFSLLSHNLEHLLRTWLTHDMLNPALKLAHFGRWALRDKTAQSRLAQTLGLSRLTFAHIFITTTHETPMIRISLLYPNNKDSRFDISY